MAVEHIGSERKRGALALFSGLGRRYDLLSAALSFGQDPRWRRALVDAVKGQARHEESHRWDTIEFKLD